MPPPDWNSWKQPTQNETQLPVDQEQGAQGVGSVERPSRGASSKKWVLIGSIALATAVAGIALLPRLIQHRQPAAPIPLPESIPAMAPLVPASQAPANSDVTVESEVSSTGGPAVSSNRFRTAPTRAPRLSSLVLQGGADGLQVYIDGELRGTLKSDGALSIADIQPGQHNVELRKEGYLSRKWDKGFAAATPFTLNGDQVVLEKAPGSLQIVLSPAGAHVTYRQQNETQNHALEGNKVDLPEGSYVVTANAPGYAERSQNIQIVAGQSQHLDFQLAPLKLKPVSHGMAEWETTGGWRHDGDWYVRRGGDFFLYPITPTAGDLRFTANLRRGRRFQWVLNYVDAKNYLLFQIDKNNFVRYQVVDGKRTKLRETPHGLDPKDACQLQINLVPGKIAHQVYENGKWHPLDEWNDIPESLRSGKFGFYIPGSDELAVSRFEFVASK